MLACTGPGREVDLQGLPPPAAVSSPMLHLGLHQSSTCVNQTMIQDLTILTQIMADEFNFLWSAIQNCIAETEADLIPVPGQLDLHGRCRYGVLLSPCFCALYVSQI